MEVCVCVCIYIYIYISLHLQLICNWILHSLRSQLSLSVTLALDIDTYNEFLVWKPHFFKNCELDEWFNFNVRRHNLDSESESFLKSTHSESWWEDSNEKDGGKYLIELRILWISFTSLVAQTVKNLPAIQEIQIQSMGQEDPLEKEMATHSSILAWELPWTEKPGSYNSWGHKESPWIHWRKAV